MINNNIFYLWQKYKPGNYAFTYHLLECES